MVRVMGLVCPARRFKRPPEQGKVAVKGSPVLRQEVTYMVKDSLDAINVVFDDDRSVADAGVLLVATLGVSSGSRR